jgi:PTH2 family peptidyl-tRNA hydrolase
MDYKQCLIVRNDLKISCGKLCVQVSHASLDSYLISNRIIRRAWHNEGQKKVILEVNSEQELLDLAKKAQSRALECALIYDLGLTELKPNTLTCMGLEINENEVINEITGELNLFKFK